MAPGLGEVRATGSPGLSEAEGPCHEESLTFSA
jgi:hypothetical protein